MSFFVHGMIFGAEVRSNYIIHQLVGGDSSHEDFLDGYYFRKNDWVSWGCRDLVGKSVRLTYRLSDDPSSGQRINVVTSVQPEKR